MVSRAKKQFLASKLCHKPMSKLSNTKPNFQQKRSGRKISGRNHEICHAPAEKGERAI